MPIADEIRTKGTMVDINQMLSAWQRRSDASTCFAASGGDGTTRYYVFVTKEIVEQTRDALLPPRLALDHKGS